jgi:hypothetical protein
MIFCFGCGLPGIYLDKVYFLSAFCVLFLLKRYSLFIPVCDMTHSFQIKYVTLDTKQAYVKYSSKQKIFFIHGNFVPECVTENMGHFLVNRAFRLICFRKILCCVVQSGG